MYQYPGPISAAPFRARPSAASYSAESAAAFAQMTNQPSIEEKNQLNTLMSAFVILGIAKFAGIYFLASTDAQAASINWKNPSGVKLTTLGSAPTFITKRGYKGNGVDQALSTGIAQNAASPYAIDNAHFGVFIGDDVANSAMYDAGTAEASICSRVGSTGLSARFRPQVSSNNDVLFSAFGTTATSVGHSLWVRTGTAVTRYQKDGSAFQAGVPTSVALDADPFYICARNGVANAATDFSSRLVQIVHFGSQLTQAEGAFINTACRNYLNAVGAL